MKPISIVRAVVAVIIIVIGVFVMKGLTSLKTDPPVKEFKAAKQYVKVDEVKLSTVAVEIFGSGRVVSGRSVALLSEVQGKLLEGQVPLKKGRSFKKGQLLFRIDNTEAKFSLSAQKSQFLNLVAGALPDIKIDYASVYPQWQQFFNALDVTKNFAELPDLSDPKLKTFIASRSILNQYYTIKSAEERLSKHSFYAPFSGTFSMVQFEVGATANPGVAIATIIQTGGGLEIEVPLPASDAKWLSRYAVATAENGEGQKWTGRVIRIGDRLDAATQSISVFVELKSNDVPLYEGMYLDVNISGPDVEDAYEIPRKALLTNERVWTVKDTTLAAMKVNVVKLNPDAAIIKGLPKGTSVVVEPLVNAKEDMTVEPINASAE